MSIDQLCMKQECWALEMLGRVGALTQCPIMRALMLMRA